MPPVASLSQLPPGALLAVTLPSGTRICLANVEGDVFAVRDSCPHQAFPLSEGTLLPGGVLECAWHGQRFDCRTGRAASPQSEGRLIRFPVTVEGEAIYVHEEMP